MCYLEVGSCHNETLKCRLGSGIALRQWGGSPGLYLLLVEEDAVEEVLESSRRQELLFRKPQTLYQKMPMLKMALGQK